MNEALVSFFVEGEPRPKQSFRVGRNGGFTPARVKAWQTDVACDAQKAMREAGRFNQPFTGTLGAEIRFCLGNHRRVDLDNLNKAVLDGMNRIVFEDDQQVATLFLSKQIVKNENPRVCISVGTEDQIRQRIFLELLQTLDRRFVEKAIREF